MSNNKTLKVFSSTAVAGMIAAAMMSSQAFAAVDAYSVKVGDAVYKYDKAQLEKSFLDSKAGEKSALYEDFTKKLAEAKGFYGFNDNKNGLVDYSSIEAKFLEAKGAGQKFDVNAFTESKDAKIVEAKVVKKAVVKDGKVEYVTEGQENGELKVESIEALSLKQLKINFNQKVTDTDKKDDIEDVNNYTLEDKDGDELDNEMIKEVKLDESKKFAILTFNDKVDSKGKYLIENQEKYTLRIDEDVTGDEVTNEIVFKDTKLPEIVKTEVVGKDTLKVTFSEPVMPYNMEAVSESIGKKESVSPQLDDDDFEINGGDLSITEVQLVNNNTEANIIVGTSFKDGEEVKVRAKSSVRDYAGLTTVSGTQKTIVKEDKKAPTIIGYKDIDTEDIDSVTYEKVTLVFDKDIKFKNMDQTEITNESDLENYYHTNDKDSNRPKKVKIDGKELTLYFEDDTFANGTTNIYIKSDAIESRWEVKNYKLSQPIEKEKDTTAPELTRVEQHEDYNNRIKIKFSEKVKAGDKTQDKSALKAKNYTLTDQNGKDWKIDRVEKDGTSDKEFIIVTTKDLDEDLKYKLTVENVEDKAGNAIKKVTKEFKVKDNDGVEEEDIKVKVYSAGLNSQKMVIDFDTKMKMDSSRFSAKDLTKYTLIARDKSDKSKLLNVFDGKSSINLADMYKSDIKSAKDGKAVEINLPSKEKKADLKDKQFKLNDLAVDGIKEENIELYVQIDRVEDANGNVTTRNFEKGIEAFLGKGEKGSITFDTDEDYEPQIISPEEIFLAFDDKVDFNLKDIKVIAADSKEKAEAAAAKLAGKDLIDEDLEKVKLDGAKLLPIATHEKDKNTDGNTTVKLTMNKDLKDNTYDDDDYNHVFTYDGKYLDKDGKCLDVYVLAVPNKIVDNEPVTSTKNDYDETLVTGKAVLVKDKLAPVVKDNDRLAKGHRYGYDQENTDEVVEYSYDKDNNKGSIVVTFEEDIDPASVSRSSVTLNKDDFKDAKVSKVYVENDKNEPNKPGKRVVIEVKDLTDGKDNNGELKKVELERGHEIILKGVRDVNDNEAKELKLQVGDFDDITTRDNKKTVEDAVEDIKNENVKLKFENAELPTVTANIEKDKENVKLADAIAVKDIAKELIPSKVVIGDKTINNITQNPTDEVIKSVQDAIVALVNGEEGKKTFDQITLADLKEKSIKANINGVEYTLSVAK